jgi:hypothetical protein
MGSFATKSLMVTPNMTLSLTPSEPNFLGFNAVNLEIDGQMFRIQQLRLEELIRGLIKLKQTFTICYRPYDNLIIDVELHKKSI